jgi:DNA adenine methylase
MSSEATVATKRSKKKKKNKLLLSPFRYPGGKSWLKQIVQQWLTPPVAHLVEAFAGGANVTIAALELNLSSRATLIEIDPDVSAVWSVVFNGEVEWLSKKIRYFRVNHASVTRELEQSITELRDRAWITLLRNRVSHGGIMARGAGILRRGEDDHGLKSRWYSKTLRDRIKRINAFTSKVTFLQTDALKWLAKAASTEPAESTAYFIDPPYATAGKRLYTYGQIEHSRLFKLASKLHGKVLMTYENTKEIRCLAKTHGFEVREIDMRSRQHRAKVELLIAKDFSWLKI